MDDIDIYSSVRSTGMHDVLIDLLGSLSAVKTLSELESHKKLSEKELVLNSLSILIENQDMECCSFFIKTENNELINLTGVGTKERKITEKEDYTPVTFKMGEGLVGLAAEKEESQYCADCSIDSRFSNKYFQAEVLGSIISVPVKVGGSCMVF